MSRTPGLIFLWTLSMLIFCPAARAASLLEEFPGLERYAYKEKKSPFYLGVGVSPAGFSERKFLFSVSPLQFHYRSELLDVEAAGLTIGWSQPKASYGASQFFLVRTVPKIRFFDVLSVGPFVAYEGHLFRGVTARLRKGRQIAPYERFSSAHYAWGGVVSESFPLANGRVFKINQVFLQQRYSVRDAGRGWRYEYEREEIELEDKLSDLEPSKVFSLEIAILF